MDIFNQRPGSGAKHGMAEKQYFCLEKLTTCAHFMPANIKLGMDVGLDSFSLAFCS